MKQTSLKAITAAILITASVLSLPSPAKAGWGCGWWGCGWGPAFVIGVGALVGTALFGPRVYAYPPPPYYYGPTAYGPPYYYGQTGYGPPPAYYGHTYYGRAGYRPPDYDGRAGYRPPPRTPSGYSNRPNPPSTLPSATAKTGAITASKQKMEAKLKLAQAKAKRDGVASLTKQDIEGLSPEQIKQLRGY